MSEVVSDSNSSVQHTRRSMTYAEMEAKVAHFDNDRRILWYAWKCLFSRVGSLEAEATKLRRELAIERKVSGIIESRCRETMDKQDEEISHLKKALQYKQELHACEMKQLERQLAAAYRKLRSTEQTNKRIQNDCSELKFLNQQLSAQKKELKQQAEDRSLRIAECEKTISSQQATLAARPPVSSWAPSAVKPKSWSLPAQNARIAELEAEKEDLTEQLTSVQQQKEELQQQCQQLQETLQEAEVCEWDQAFVSKRVVQLEGHNLRLVAEKEELAGQLASVLQQQEVLQQQSQQLQEALQEAQVCEWDQGLVSKRMVQLEEQKLQLEAAKEELAEQLGSMRQQNHELLQQSQQLQEALHEAEVDQSESSMVGKRVADLGVKNLLLELDLDNATASNQHLRDRVAGLQSQLQSLQAKNIMDKQHQAVAASDPLAAAQAGLKPVAVPSPSSNGQDSQPEQPDTPELSELELSSCSCLSSGQSSRRTSEVCQPCSPESFSSKCSAASSSSTSAAMEKINSLHPLYGYWSWVQDSSSQ